MNWGSLDNFLAMGGYGLYVWGSYAMALLVVAVEAVALLRRRRTLMQSMSLIRQTDGDKDNETTA